MADFFSSKNTKDIEKIARELKEQLSKEMMMGMDHAPKTAYGYDAQIVYQYVDVVDGALEYLNIPCALNSNNEALLTMDQWKEVNAAELRVSEFNKEYEFHSMSGSSAKFSFAKGMMESENGVKKARDTYTHPKPKSLSDDLFWELAGMFGWEGRKLEDIEVTLRLETGKPVTVTTQYKDHGKEKFGGDAETTSEFALVLEKYQLTKIEEAEE